MGRKSLLLSILIAFLFIIPVRADETQTDPVSQKILLWINEHYSWALGEAKLSRNNLNEPLGRNNWLFKDTGELKFTRDNYVVPITIWYSDLDQQEQYGLDATVIAKSVLDINTNELDRIYLDDSIAQRWNRDFPGQPFGSYNHINGFGTNKIFIDLPKDALPFIYVSEISTSGWSANWLGFEPINSLINRSIKHFPDKCFWEEPISEWFSNSKSSTHPSAIFMKGHHPLREGEKLSISCEYRKEDWDYSFPFLTVEFLLVDQIERFEEESAIKVDLSGYVQESSTNCSNFLSKYAELERTERTIVKQIHKGYGGPPIVTHRE